MDFSFINPIIDFVILFVVYESIFLIGAYLIQKGIFLAFISNGYKDITAKIMVGYLYLFFNLIATILALSLAGFDLLYLFSSLIGVFVISIKGFLPNLVSGYTLLIIQAFKEGDIIGVNGVVGEVENIGLTVTTIKTFDGLRVFVPNASWIMNYSFYQDLRAEIKIYISQIDDSLLIKLINDISKVDGISLKVSPSFVINANLLTPPIELNCYFWVKNTASYFEVTSEVFNLIHQKFMDNQTLVKNQKITIL